jgi:hypothetical protein
MWIKNNHMKTCSASLTIRKIQIRTIVETTTYLLEGHKLKFKN